MKATDVIKLIQEKVNKYGDLDILISQSDNFGGEVATADIFVYAMVNNPFGNYIVIEEKS